MLLLAFAAAALAQDATLTPTDDAREPAIGIEVVVVLQDPTLLAFEALRTTCDQQEVAELVKLCHAQVADFEKAFGSRYAASAPVETAPQKIRRRTKGGFVVDIDGIEESLGR